MLRSRRSHIYLSDQPWGNAGAAELARHFSGTLGLKYAGKLRLQAAREHKAIKEAEKARQRDAEQNRLVEARTREHRRIMRRAERERALANKRLALRGSKANHTSIAAISKISKLFDTTHKAHVVTHAGDSAQEDSGAEASDVGYEGGSAPAVSESTDGSTVTLTRARPPRRSILTPPLSPFLLTLSLTRCGISESGAHALASAKLRIKKKEEGDCNTTTAN